MTEIATTLRECAEMVADGRQNGLTEFWHKETAKITAEACAAAADALDAAQQRIAALEAALEPFARRAFEFEAADDEWFCGPPVQVKHLRAARYLLPSLPSSISNG